ncbi:hypothetical protein OPT61_g8774 [Boeremia exigua]|uniref:Uncharacterized protein n=1 Tax=Boeremia exigua TaxID=749465 RepID=A0ACC2HWU0_9PLEO|nr:hypothetical protein OPT61_g8774 [Boeremia exigua]
MTRRCGLWFRCVPRQHDAAIPSAAVSKKPRESVPQRCVQSQTTAARLFPNQDANISLRGPPNPSLSSDQGLPPLEAAVRSNPAEIQSSGKHNGNQQGPASPADPQERVQDSAPKLGWVAKVVLWVAGVVEGEDGSRQCGSWSWRVKN